MLSCVSGITSSLFFTCWVSDGWLLFSCCVKSEVATCLFLVTSASSFSLSMLQCMTKSPGSSTCWVSDSWLLFSCCVTSDVGAHSCLSSSWSLFSIFFGTFLNRLKRLWSDVTVSFSLLEFEFCWMATWLSTGGYSHFLPSSSLVRIHSSLSLSSSMLSWHVLQLPLHFHVYLQSHFHPLHSHLYPLHSHFHPHTLELIQYMYLHHLNWCVPCCLTLRQLAMLIVSAHDCPESTALHTLYYK